MKYKKYKESPNVDCNLTKHISSFNHVFRYCFSIPWITVISLKILIIFTIFLCCSIRIDLAKLICLAIFLSEHRSICRLILSGLPSWLLNRPLNLVSQNLGFAIIVSEGHLFDNWLFFIESYLRNLFPLLFKLLF